MKNKFKNLILGLSIAAVSLFFLSIMMYYTPFYDYKNYYLIGFQCFSESASCIVSFILTCVLFVISIAGLICFAYIRKNKLDTKLAIIIAAAIFIIGILAFDFSIGSTIFSKFSRQFVLLGSICGACAIILYSVKSSSSVEEKSDNLKDDDLEEDVEEDDNEYQLLSAGKLENDDYDGITEL